MKKRILLTLFALSLLVAVFAVTVSATANVAVEDGVIVGLDTAKTYEWTTVDVNGPADEWTTVTDTDNITIDGAAGLYAVRVAGAADYELLYIRGTEVGTLDFMAQRWKSGTSAYTYFPDTRTENGTKTAEATGFFPGVWTKLNGEAYGTTYVNEASDAYITFAGIDGNLEVTGTVTETVVTTEEKAVVDENGDPVLDAEGNPTYETVEVSTDYTYNTISNEQVTSLAFAYQLTANEIIPLAEFKAIAFGLQFANGANPFSVSRSPMLRVYVEGADVDYFDVPAAQCVGASPVTCPVLASIYAANPDINLDGVYVTGLSFHLYSPLVYKDDFVRKSNATLYYMIYPGTLDRGDKADYTDNVLTYSTLTEKHAAPALTVSSGADGKYVLSGFNKDDKYLINDTILVKGAVSYVLDNAGVYSVYTLSDAQNLASDVAVVTCGAQKPATTGLTVADGVISGFAADTAYEIAKVHGAELAWADVTAETVLEGAGLWLVRVKADDTAIAGAPQALYVAGDAAGQLTFSNTSDDTTGKWTTPYGGAVSNTTPANYHWNHSNYPTQMPGYAYLMTDAQIAPVADYSAIFNFVPNLNINGNPFTESFDMKIVMWVLDENGAIVARSQNVPYINTTRSATIAGFYADEIAEDAAFVSEDYVLGFTIYYIDPDNTALTFKSKLSGTYEYALFTLSTSSLVAKAAAATPVITAEHDFANKTVVLTGFDADKVYYINDTIKVTGVTEYTVEPGTYTVYSAESMSELQSASVEVVALEFAEFVGAPVVDGTSITGLDTEVLYEYAQFNALWDGTWTALDAGSASITGLTDGLWAVRNPATATTFATEPQYLLVGDHEGASTAVVTGGAAANTAKGTLGNFSHGRHTTTNSVLASHKNFNTRNGMYPQYIDTAADFVEKQTIISYYFDNDEILPVNELVNINYYIEWAGAHFNVPFMDATGARYAMAKFPTALRVYVAGGDVDYYEFVGFAGVNPKNLQSVIPADAKGYAYKLEFITLAYAPDDMTPDPWLFSKDGVTQWHGQMYTVLRMTSFTVKTNGVAPVVTVAASANGYVISGLDAELNYVYSTDNAAWTPVAAGSTQFEVTEAGTYYIKSLASDIVTESPVTEFVIKAKADAVTGLTYADGVISGLDATKAYEYMAYTMLETEWTAVEAGSTSIEAPAGALYAVRLAETETTLASYPQYILAKGGNFGSIGWRIDPDVRAARTTGPVVGAWNGIYSNAYVEWIGNNPWIIGGLSTATVEDAMKAGYIYTMSSDEIIPVTNLDSFNYINTPNANPFSNTSFKGRWRFYVVDGTVDYYDYFVNYAHGETMTINPSDVIPADAEGYVEAIEFVPYYGTSDGSALDLIKTSSTYVKGYMNYYVVPGNENLDNKSDLKYRTQIYGVPAPAELTVEAVEGTSNYYKGNKIVGFDAEKVYEYSTNGGVSYVAIEQGTTELVLGGGTYLVRYAKTETQEQSKAVEVYVPFLNPVFANHNLTSYSAKAQDGFVPGWWTVSGISSIGKEAAANPNVCTYIGSGNKLSAIAMRFEFPENENFSVNDYPFFGIDFNVYAGGTTPVNPADEGAVYAIDIYVDGVETPYTVTSEWKNNAYNADGTTPNTVFVNLADEYPELIGKTIRAIEIKPFSNIESTLGEISSGAYYYFRQFYVGFFDSPANRPGSYANGSNQNANRVNTLTGIEAATDVIYPIGGEFNKDDINVALTYSNGATWAVEGFTANVPEDFATVSGTYTVTVEYLGMTADIEITAGLESIEVNADNAKVNYIDGDKVDLTGLEVIAVLADGSETAVTGGYSADIDVVALDTTSITITYAGLTASYDITVVPVAVTSIAINTLPDKEVAGGYEAGEAIDLTGLTVLATNNNGTTEVIALENLEWTYTADVMTYGGVLTVSYAGFTIEGTVLTVNVPLIENVVVATWPTKTSYLVGDEIDKTGLTFTVTYDNGDVVTVTDVTNAVIDADLTSTDTTIATIIYEGFSFEYEILVRDVDMAFISQSPDKTEYTVGEEFDPTGLLLYVVYTDGSEDEISEGFSFNYGTFTEAGTVTVTLTYGWYTEDFDVTVEEAQVEEPVVLDSITVTAPTKTTYTVGDTLDTAGMTVTANYSDGSTADVTADATVDTTTLATAGTITVTVTYEGKNATFTVTVEEAQVEEPEDIASGTIEGTNITWTISADKVLTVSGEGAIPDYTSTTYAPWRANFKNITSIVVEDGITRIGKYAFNTLSNVTAITVADSVKEVGSNAFRRTAATEISLMGVETLEFAALAGGNSFSRVYLSESFRDARDLPFASNGVTVIAPADSYADKYVAFVQTRSTFTGSIGFEANGTATQPVLDFGSAGDKAYWAIYKETSTLKRAIEISGEGKMKSFYYICDKNIALDAGKDTMFSPFYYMRRDDWTNTKKIKELVIRDGITTIGNYFFYGLAITSVDISDNLTEIGCNAFWACAGLTTVTLPETLTTIGRNAFNGCTALTAINIPDAVTSFGTNIFFKCKPANMTVTTTNAQAIEYIESLYPTMTIVSE